MIKYLKAKNHKGISEIYLSNLGYINIICGKNNSGKTSILEALNMPSNVGIGKNLDNNCKERLEDLFTPLSESYSKPSPEDSRKWFSKYVTKIINEDTIWFSDEKDKIIKSIIEDMRESLGRYQKNLFNFKLLVDEFFQEIIENYKTILIPPKRYL